MQINHVFTISRFSAKRKGKINGDYVKNVKIGREKDFHFNL